MLPVRPSRMLRIGRHLAASPRMPLINPTGLRLHRTPIRPYSSSDMHFYGGQEDIAISSLEGVSPPRGITLVSDYITERSDLQAISREVRRLTHCLTKGRDSKDAQRWKERGIRADRMLVRTSDEFGRTICNVFGENLVRLGTPEAENPEEDHTETEADELPYLHTLYRYMLKVGKEYFPEGKKVPNAVQINVYEPHGRCPMHVDAKSLGPCIAMVSFESAAVMSASPDPGDQVIDQEEIEALPDHVNMLLRPGSLLLLEDEARYNWMHGIHDGATQSFGPEECKTEIQKDHRISVVFWHMKL